MNNPTRQHDGKNTRRRDAAPTALIAKRYAQLDHGILEENYEN